MNILKIILTLALMYLQGSILLEQDRSGLTHEDAHVASG